MHIKSGFEMFFRKLRLFVPLALSIPLVALLLYALPVSISYGAVDTTFTVCDTGCSFTNLQAAIAAAGSGDTIRIGSGTFTENGQIQITKNLTITALSTQHIPVLKPAQDTSTLINDDRAWILVDADVIFNLSYVTLDGSGREIMEAIRSHGSGTISNVTFRNIQFTNVITPADPYSPGTAIFMNNGNITVQNSAFENIGRNGVLACTSNAQLSFNNNTYTGKDDEDGLDIAVWVGGGAQASIQNNVIIKNSGSITDVTSTGIRVDGSSVFCPYNAPSSAEITGNTILDSEIGIQAGNSITDTSVVTITFNRIVGNSIAGVAGLHSNNSYNAEENWWGCNAGPGSSGCDTITGNIAFTPTLQLSIDADPTTLAYGKTSGITASLKSANGHIPDDTPVVFSTSNGSIAPTSGAFAQGEAQTTFTADDHLGASLIYATVDNQSVQKTVSINQIKVLLPAGLSGFLEDNADVLGNGNFESGIEPWVSKKGSFLSNGSGLTPNIVTFEGSRTGRIGDPAFTDGTIPVGYGVISQTFYLPYRYLQMQYRVGTYDTILGAGNKYYDTFEVSINKEPASISDSERTSRSCAYSSLNPSGVFSVSSSGLIFCGGSSGTQGTLRDTGWTSIKLDLQPFVGQTITMYFAVWSREYVYPYYQDKAWYNTWAYIDNLTVIP